MKKILLALVVLGGISSALADIAYPKMDVRIVSNPPSGMPVVSGTFVTSPSATFKPICGRDFNVSGWGALPPSVQLLRSFDGLTWLPITAAGVTLYSWTNAFSEIVSEPECGVSYRFEWSGSAAGSLRISQ